MSNHYFKELADKGLNLQAIFSITDLPSEIQHSLRANCKDIKQYTQLVLLGHGGKRLWNEVKSWQADQNNCNCDNIEQSQIEDPIDNFSIAHSHKYFHDNYSTNDYKIIFPHRNSQGQIKQHTRPIDLQALGKLVGWHNESPFKVGINEQWGTWFTYRAIVLLKSDIKLITNPSMISPCVTCVDKPCLVVCPANSVNETQINIKDCINYRITDKSNCKSKCLSRLACPVKLEHQYNSKQMSYHYSLSMRMIDKLKLAKEL